MGQKMMEQNEKMDQFIKKRVEKLEGLSERLTKVEENAEIRDEKIEAKFSTLRKEVEQKTQFISNFGNKICFRWKK